MIWEIPTSVSKRQLADRAVQFKSVLTDQLLTRHAFEHITKAQKQWGIGWTANSYEDYFYITRGWFSDMKCIAATNDATALLDHAIKSLPEDTYVFDMTPDVPTGFLFLAQPIQCLNVPFIAFWWATDITVDTKHTHHVKTLFVSGITPDKDMFITTHEIRPERTITTMRADIKVLPIPPQIHPTFGAIGETYDQTLFDLKVVIAFNLLLAQQVTESEEILPSRQIRRQAERQGRPINPVTLVQLPSRHSHHPNGASNEAPNWTHRWIVSGHWRRQWYGIEQVHRPKWIAPYIKGPDDQPLVVKEKRYIFDPPSHEQ